MAATMRGTPTFVPPATQNTAPVHEFRCLYTHDVRKKAKKWHDGSTRFHTFNKRVMVYDDSKNFIGDLHYRADEEFGEGTELQLDRGVLVEVAERIGQTQTDLTGIIHRPHLDAASPSTTTTTPAPLPCVQRAQISTPQGRPKSLAELLGPSQGRHGRAYLPVQSPFEQRQTLSSSNDQHTEPPTKRQKIVTGKENDRPVHAPVQPNRLPETSRRRHIPASRISKAPEENQRSTVVRTAQVRAGVARKVIDISSDDEVPLTLGLISSSPQGIGEARFLQNKGDQPFTNVYDKNTSTYAPPSDGRIRRVSTADHELPQQESVPEISNAVAPASNSTTGSSNAHTKPRTTSLKMASQKKRRKLMYKALLPSITPVQVSRAQSSRPRKPSTVAENDISAQQNCEPGHRVPEDNTDTPFEIDDLDDLISPSIDPPEPARVPSTPPVIQDCLSRSPLFVSQSLSQRSPLPTQAFVEDDFNMPATQAVIDPGNLPNTEAVKPGNDTSEPQSPVFPHPPPKTRTNTPSLSKHMPPPQQLESLSAVTCSGTAQPQASKISAPAKSKPFARCLSEHDPPLPYDPRTSPLRAVRQAEELTHVNEARPPPPPHPMPLPPKSCTPVTSLARPPLHRSNSDTATIAPNVITAPKISPAEVDSSNDEQGPWTKLEAFLLFDKWPSCKEKDKPVFENPIMEFDPDGFDHDDNIDDDGIGVNSSRFGGSRARVPPVLIRSARCVLRDEY